MFHEGSYQSNAVLVEVADHFLGEFKTMKRCVVDKPMIPKPAVNHSWSIPLANILKLNTNASIKVNNGVIEPDWWYVMIWRWF